MSVLAFLIFFVPGAIALIFLAYWWAIKTSAEDMND